jgi:hypothetical protein
LVVFVAVAAAAVIIVFNYIKKMQDPTSRLKHYQLNFLISYIWFLNWPF